MFAQSKRRAELVWFDIVHNGIVTHDARHKCVDGRVLAHGTRARVRLDDEGERFVEPTVAARVRWMRRADVV